MKNTFNKVIAAGRHGTFSAIATASAAEVPPRSPAPPRSPPASPCAVAAVHGQIVGGSRRSSAQRHASARLDDVGRSTKRRRRGVGAWLAIACGTPHRKRVFRHLLCAQATQPRAALRRKRVSVIFFVLRLPNPELLYDGAGIKPDCFSGSRRSTPQPCRRRPLYSFVSPGAVPPAACVLFCWVFSSVASLVCE